MTIGLLIFIILLVGVCALAWIIGWLVWGINRASKKRAVGILGCFLGFGFIGLLIGVITYAIADPEYPTSYYNHTTPSDPNKDIKAQIERLRLKKELENLQKENVQ